MMSMKEHIRPGVMLSEMLFPHLGRPGIFADSIERIIGIGFYENVEILPILDADERQRVGELIRTNGLSLNSWMSFIQMEEGLDLGSLDEGHRRKSVARTIEFMEPAAEVGTRGFGVLVGPDPGPAQRAAVIDALVISFCELGDAISAFTPMHLLFEPMDREAHKKGVIGPTSEFVPLTERVRKHYPQMGVCWDSSHIALNGEDLCDSLEASWHTVTQIHFANPVLDLQSPVYGDTHQPFGPPGIIGPQKIADVILKAEAIGMCDNERPYMSVEVRTTLGGDPWETDAHQRETLSQAWALYEKAKRRL